MVYKQLLETLFCVWLILNASKGFIWKSWSCNLLQTFISRAKLQLLKTFFVADSVNTFPRACRLHSVTSELQASYKDKGTAATNKGTAATNKGTALRAFYSKLEW